MFCHNCGNPLAAGANSCARCGTLARSVHAPVSAASVTRKRPAAITILAVLNILGGVLSIIAAAAVFALSFAGEMKEMEPVVAALLAAFLAILGLIGVMTGAGLLRLRSWARSAQIVLSCIGLLGFPMGTIVHALILFYLFRPGMSALFSGRPTSAMTGDELAAIEGLQKSGAGLAIAIVAVMLGGLVILGILAAIAIPNLLTAVQRSKQKRSAADIRAVASAWEARATDFNTYLSPGEESSPLRDISSTELNTMLTPTYIKSIPPLDGWGHPLAFAASGQIYRIASSGKDGVFEARPTEGATTNFSCDIVFSNGKFVSYPEGIAAE